MTTQTLDRPAYDPSLEDQEVAPSYENAPIGTYPGTLVDLIPVGLVTMKGMKPGEPDRESFQIKLVFAIEEKNSKGYSFNVRRQLALSLHRKATLRPFFETLAGRKVSQEEESGKKRITVKSMAHELIGKSALLSLVASPTGQYTNVAGCIPLPSGMKPPVIDPYTRLKDREQ
jgi:hypothetical protein